MWIFFEKEVVCRERRRKGRVRKRKNCASEK
jgi:hypothetical protein